MFKKSNLMRHIMGSKDAFGKEEAFKKAFDFARDAVVILSEDNTPIYFNRSAVSLLGLKQDGHDKSVLSTIKFRDGKRIIPLRAILDQVCIKQNRPQPYIRIFLKREEAGAEIPVNLYIDGIQHVDNAEEVCYKIVLLHDLQDLVSHESSSFRHQVTGLPNQAQLQIDLDALFAKMHLEDKRLALLVADIDNFVILRSLIGDHETNRILVAFAKHLANIDTGLAYRLYHTYHNKFLLLVDGLEKRDEIVFFAEKIQHELALLSKDVNVSLHLSASIGISLYPDLATRETLLDTAYQALAAAQGKGYGKYIFFTPESIRQEYDRLALFKEMSSALENGEFEVFYQPIVLAKTKEIVGAEALVRWNHPKRGLIPPGHFIPIMEKTGFIIEVGEYIFKKVLKQIKQWELFGFKEIQISINVTMLELERKGFAEYVARQLTHHQVSPDRLKLEITEGHAMQSEYLTLQELSALKSLGVSISLDDFGTGYTSFSYLKKFPADILKIDKTMVDNILTQNEDRKIVQAMIALGHTLGMQIVVEGVESQEMFDLVGSFGCDYIQGYHIAKPLPVFEFQDMIRG